MVEISVIIPVRNGGATLSAQLEALARQDTDRRWEVLVVDNGSTDASRAVAESFAGRLPHLRVLDAAERRGVAHARNVGVRAAAGDIVLFCDADDEVRPDWITEMSRALEHADAVGGCLERSRLNAAAIVGPDRDRTTGLNPWPGYLPFAPGGNFGLHRTVWEQLGDQDESYSRFGAEDVAFCWHLQLAGFRLAFAPEAVVDSRDRVRLRDLVRQHYHFGEEDPHLFREFRSHGMPPASFRRALRSWAWLVVHAPGSWRTATGRRNWSRVAARRAGRLVSSLRGPTRYW